MVSCGKWQQYRTAGGTGSLQLEAYIDGFLSGYNVGSDGPDLLAAKPDEAQRVVSGPDALASAGG
jgi:hypothetical protein